MTSPISDVAAIIADILKDEAASEALEAGALQDVEARMAELRLHIVSNERAGAYYSKSRMKGANAILIRHCTQRIAAATYELETLAYLVELSAREG
jgi:hypothetical protein